MEQLLGQVLGPLGALALAFLVLVFAYRVWQSFLSEGFVSGATYRRVVDQNVELTKLLGTAVDAAETLTRKDEKQTDQLWQMAGQTQPRPGRSRSRSVADEVGAVERSLGRGGRE